MTNMGPIQCGCCLVVLLLVSLPAANSCEAGELITVTLEDGRQWTASMDARTNGSHLWLRFRGDVTTLLRPVPWSQVQSTVRIRPSENPMDPDSQSSPPHTHADLALEALMK